MNGVMEFMVIAAVVAMFLYGLDLFKNHQDALAIKLRRDGKPEFERVSSTSNEDFPILIKIFIFIVIASVLFIPLDFILNRS